MLSSFKAWYIENSWILPLWRYLMKIIKHFIEMNSVNHSWIIHWRYFFFQKFKIMSSYTVQNNEETGFKYSYDLNIPKGFCRLCITVKYNSQSKCNKHRHRPSFKMPFIKHLRYSQDFMLFAFKISFNSHWSPQRKVAVCSFYRWEPQSQ